MHIVTSKDGTRIAYDKVGQGPPVILVSGAFSYRKFPAAVQLTHLLAEYFSVYNYDRRGRGDSSDSDVYKVEREIEDLEALIDAAGGSACVWGLSSGAVLALKAAANGLAIKKLALQEPPFIVGEHDRLPPKDFIDQTTALIASNRRDEAIKYFMVQGMGAPGFVIPVMRMMPGVWPRLKAVAHTLPYDAKLLEGYIDGKPLSDAEWSSLTISTLVMAGSESPPSLRNASKSLADVLPNAQLLMQKGLGHTKKLSVKVIAPVLIEFFKN